MRKWVAGLAVGVVLGFVLGSLLPVQARDSQDRRSLATRVAVLERKTKHLNSSGYISGDYVKAPQGCLVGDPAVWQGFLFTLSC